MTYSDDRGSGRIAQWQPQPPIATQPQPQSITPADFMAGMASLQAAMQQQTAALAQHQAALAQYQQHQAALAQHQAAPIAPWQAPAPYPQWQAPPQWGPPAPPAPPLHTTIAPIIHIEASSHSAQDNGGGGWFGLALAAFFFIPLTIAAVGGR